MCPEKKLRGGKWQKERSRRRRDGRLSLLDLCVHYGMPSIPPPARGRRHGNSCSPVTAETREMLDIKKMTYSYTAVFIFILWVCVWQSEVCCSIFMKTDICRCRERAEETSWQRDAFFCEAPWLVLTLWEVSCHLDSSRNRQLKTEKPSWDAT